MLNTKFWDDNYINRLEPIDKLLFLYFLTNSLSNWCGIYEISLQKMSFDTGVDLDTIKKTIDKFTSDKKIFYIDGYICVINFIKNQNINKNTEIAVKRELDAVPKDILLSLVKKVDPSEAFGSLPNDSEGLGRLYLTKLDLTKLICNFSDHQKIVTVIDIFKEINPTINFGHKTHRSSIMAMEEKLGFEEVVKIAKIAVAVQGQRYAPTITTPTELRNKMGALAVYIKKHQNEETKGIVL